MNKRGFSLTKFGHVIACLTLGSGVEIEFTRPKHESFKIYTEPNSLYIMSGDARYFWKHAISQRKNDKINGKNKPRGTRISLTFRNTHSIKSQCFESFMSERLLFSRK